MKWISSEERLPEESDSLHIRDVLVFVPDLNRITFGWHFDGDWHIENSPSVWKVTHWMPLPEPPEE